MVDGQVGVLAGATGAGPTTRAPTRFPEVNASFKTQPPQMGHQGTAGNSCPYYRKGRILGGTGHS
jgi:hypothetical protein